MVNYMSKHQTTGSFFISDLRILGLIFRDRWTLNPRTRKLMESSLFSHIEDHSIQRNGDIYTVQNVA